MPGVKSELALAAEAKSASTADADRADLPEVSVVIVTWNSGEELLDCLRSLHANPPSVNWEAIVVDNGSTDGSIEELRSRFPLTRVVANRHNRGLAAANNQGIAASSGAFVLISNPDVIYPAGAVDALLDLMRRRPRTAFAIAKHVHPDGELQPAAGDLPTIPEALLGQRILRRRSAGLAGVWWHSWPHDEERPIGHGAEACYLVRRSAIGEIGLQDERFVLDWEGLDWSRRAWQAGWEIWFCPSAVVTHLGGVSIRKAIPRWVVSSHLGMYRYFAASTPSLVRPLLAAAVGIRATAKFAAGALGVRAYVLARRSA
jgi:GT2 family glycosyltransferase